MQPRQSDKPSASSKPATATTTTAATTTTTPTTTTTDLRPKVKVIKSKRPLCHFKFYLDICDHQLAKRVEQDIKSLGGQLEFFLSDSITHFITDKPQLQQAQQQQGLTPQPHTPLTPNQSPLHHQQQLQQDEVRKTRQSRADAILSRVRRQTSVGGALASGGTGGAGIASSGSPVTRSYIVWQTDYAQRFFKRIQTELKAYLEGAAGGSGTGTGTAAAGSIHLKGQFVKIESIKRNYRPYYHLIKQPEDWPKLQLDSDDGAFRLQEKRRRSKSLQSGMTTRRSTEDQQQQQQNNKAAGAAGAEITKKKPQEENIIKEKESSDKQCGVCEICKLEYDTLSLHLQSKDHELFAKNPENFLALDSLIQTSANVKEFLLELNDLNEMEEQLNSSSGSKSSPALREKSKRITKGKHSSEKFASPPATKQINSPALVATSLNGGGTAAATTTPSRRSKLVVQNSGLSPPIRAMLPPSSLYKVVETIPRDDCSNTTPLRRGRAANNQNVDSPSLIVKFQKVRQSELQRLNGEAENFMFPRTTAAAVASATTRRKSSSELATDIDRQTTSDIRGRHSISSASLDTTSTSETEIASGGAGAGAVIPTAAASSAAGRAQLVARRRKLGSQQQQQQHQRFPKAPIQPEVELKQEQQQQEDLLVVATRKSSRTATAIVTAATTSNQLQLRQTNTRKTKLEDRMGDNNSSIQTPTKTKNKREVNKKRKAEEQRQAVAAAAANNNEEKSAVEEEEEDDEEEEQEDEESSCCPSSGSDEDYVANRRRRGRQTKQTKAAARRQSRLTINRNSLANKSSLNPNNTINQDQIFDCSKSERLTKMRYTFESLPTGELWHRVFNRQDRGEEEYYTYYGSTRYRKLPYEMGPIPMIKTTQLGKHKCRLCPPEAEAEPEEEVVDEAQEDARDQRKETLKINKDDVETIVKKEHLDELPTASIINTNITSSSSCSSSLYKHKKLHLLQRYQQEQLQQQQQQQQQQCDSKASTPELLEREFGSLGPLGAISRVNRVRSSSSSSCSNSQKSVNTCRNKQLARLTELPPRKSPREHASTLALVSCIIRQRQDSQNSKTNSEAEDPPPPPIKMKTPPPQRGSGSVKKEPDIVDVVVASSPRTTRSQAATPIEELRFATEISETVKRMRRGQNKYDHSPPAPATAPPLARQQRPNNNCYSRRLQFSSASVATTNSARRRPPRSSAAAAAARSSQSTNHLSFGMGIRKLPSKKGLLEYEMEPCAMKALDASMQYRSPHLMAWQIDKYLELVGKEYDFNDNGVNDGEVESQESRQEEVVTPPPTDCNFTSEFDLCDLLQGGSAGSGDDDPDSSSAVAMGGGSRRLSSTFSLYSSYYRKRKSLKSNRTGWPKAQRRRHGGGGSRHLAASDQRICFKEMGLNDISTAVVVKQEPLEAPQSQTAETTTAGEVEVERSTGDAVVMTPPATDVEPIEAKSLPDAADDDADDNDDDDDDEDDDDDDEEEEADEEAEIEATDADVEEEEEEEEDVYEDAFEEPSRDMVTPPPKEQQKMPNVDEEPPQKRSKSNSSSTTTTPTNANATTTPTKPDSGKKLLLTLHNGQRLTSTPSSTHHHPQPQQPQQQQQQRLNGSLGSCISPSEKLGDNSDIFTVSSDGLDTDLDLSNHQADCPHQQQQTTSPPKRKFDISKYAPPNNGKAASSCAAEAATAAVKSLAISQFLKKEVRVTCRRLRAPFRRFRYRR